MQKAHFLTGVAQLGLKLAPRILGFQAPPRSCSPGVGPLRPSRAPAAVSPARRAR